MTDSSGMFRIYSDGLDSDLLEPAKRGVLMDRTTLFHAYHAMVSEEDQDAFLKSDVNHFYQVAHTGRTDDGREYLTFVHIAE
ncbi:hypothetical protein SEA_ANNADREAMY_7 [Streptomyces phage Annadreamy]|uniref:Uncharacterized protein n=2 Tax=Annadreamyvirus annadreamy TaxID=2846392 RepID=A0A345GT59_9CAUD|nr:hypothetical protein HWB75_gp007 [Streptomyces phage Annadreamy]AXG66131.1 hypothetical protein SEA_ANNADREAMY_7 [Streptomyces phage Annadreamy]QGH79343.1 hypothetical protein SEA_LIMPID_7 [Streptomyces phage Limpid]